MATKTKNELPHGKGIQQQFDKNNPQPRRRAAATEVRTTLTEEQQKRRDHLVGLVKRGQAAYVEAGKALIELHEKQLYLATHDNFYAFCLEHFSFGESYARKIIATTRLALAVQVRNRSQPKLPEDSSQTETIVPELPIPPNESVGRIIVDKISDLDEQVDTWAGIVTRAVQEKVALTAAYVKQQISPPGAPLGRKGGTVQEKIATLKANADPLEFADFVVDHLEGDGYWIVWRRLSSYLLQNPQHRPEILRRLAEELADLTSEGEQAWLGQRFQEIVDSEAEPEHEETLEAEVR